MKRFSLAALIVSMVSPPAFAAIEAELDQALNTLMTGLSGAFDSGPQVRAEKLSNTPVDMEHQHVYRSFTPIDAPDVGGNVFVVTLRDDGPEGRVDMVEFQVWTLTVDAERKAVRMAPRRFKTPEDYVAITRNADAFNNLKASDLVPSSGAAGCAILWTPSSSGLIHGVSEKPCLGPIRDAMLSWEWTYILSDTALWMSFSGRNDSGKIVFGRQDQLPWRLDKVSQGFAP